MVAEKARNKNPTNIRLGVRLKQRRAILDLSLGEVAEKIGVSYQQLQKYEQGVNAPALETLEKIGAALGVPIHYFFDDSHVDADFNRGFAEEEQQPVLRPTSAKAKNELDDLDALFKAYRNIADPEKRKKILDHVRKMAKEE